jgi:hypothetical protein
MREAFLEYHRDEQDRLVEEEELRLEVDKTSVDAEDLDSCAPRSSLERHSTTSDHGKYDCDEGPSDGEDRSSVFADRHGTDEQRQHWEEQTVRKESLALKGDIPLPKNVEIGRCTFPSCFLPFFLDDTNLPSSLLLPS